MRERRRKKTEKPSFLQIVKKFSYCALISCLIYLAALLISFVTNYVMKTTGITSNQSNDVASLIEGIIAALAAGLVLYQLRLRRDEEIRQSDIEEAQFLLQVNQSFIQDKNMIFVQELLEKRVFYPNLLEKPKAAICLSSSQNDVLENTKKLLEDHTEYSEQYKELIEHPETNIITPENRQKFINYLVYLEGIAPLILHNVLRLENVDDLLAYRFFLAVNCPDVQIDQLIPFPHYYTGCFKVYKKWTEYRRHNHKVILQEKTSLDLLGDFFNRYSSGSIEN